MRINKDNLKGFQYLDKNDKVIPWDTKTGETPKNAKYWRTYSTRTISDEIYKIGKIGDSKKVVGFNSSYSPDLVMAIVKSGDYDYCEAQIIASQSCERCMNALAYKYGLDWGYPEYSLNWYETGTECDFCENDNNKSVPVSEDLPKNAEEWKDNRLNELRQKSEELNEEIFKLTQLRTDIKHEISLIYDLYTKKECLAKACVPEEELCNGKPCEAEEDNDEN